MSLRDNVFLAIPTLVVALATVVGAQDVQHEIGRHSKSTVQPAYPELARRLNIVGTVRVQIVVAPDGTVRDAKVVGGHPVLASSALDAVRKWRFEPAPGESSGTVEFKFDRPQQ